MPSTKGILNDPTEKRILRRGIFDEKICSITRSLYLGAGHDRLRFQRVIQQLRRFRTRFHF